jgi:hypothetical protein
MHGDSDEDRSGWQSVTVSFASSLVLLYAPHLWLVARHPDQTTVGWLYVFPVAPGISPTVIIALKFWSSMSDPWAFTLAGFLSLTILLIGTGIGSISRPALAFSGLLMLGYATLNIWLFESLF